MIPLDELLDFERAWPRWSGRKDEAIRARFAVPPARYFQILHRALDSRDAVELDPLLVGRLRRRRDIAATESERRRGMAS